MTQSWPERQPQAPSSRPTKPAKNSTLTRCRTTPPERTPRSRSAQAFYYPDLPSRRVHSNRTTRHQSLSKFAFLITISSSFRLLFRVLFTVPSQYLSAIGLVTIFSFGWDQPPVLGLQSQTTRLVETQTQAFRQSSTGLSPSRAYLSR